MNYARRCIGSIVRVTVAVVSVIHLKDANPVFRVGSNVRGQGVATLQGRLRQETLPHILEDDVGKVRRFHDADATAR